MQKSSRGVLNHRLRDVSGPQIVQTWCSFAGRQRYHQQRQSNQQASAPQAPIT